MFKTFTYDGVNSLDYGVHINGEGVYNAPERDVEMIAIPGRNGEYALDHGRFNNIDVVYPAGIGEASQTSFSDKLKEFRNQLASRVGYSRLEDDYHPDEFRMGIYKSGLEASPVAYNRAGEFDLTFNCKPQRFLKSGEQRTQFTSSGAITNPTLFESKPLIEMYGYGTLVVNGAEIELHNDPLGDIILHDSFTYSNQAYSITWQGSLVNNGDTITLKPFRADFAADKVGSVNTNSASGSASTKSNLTVTSELVTTPMNYYVSATANIDAITYTKGTSKTSSYSRQITINYTPKGGSATSTIWTVSLSVTYDGANCITFSMSTSFTNGQYYETSQRHVAGDGVDATSSVLSLGSPLYLDCEIGEAYKEENGEIILINKNVDIPSDLPVLSPGENTITMDNTFTKVGIIPRWWII